MRAVARPLVAVFLALPLAAAFAQVKDAQRPSQFAITPVQRAALTIAQRRGITLYAYDQAAWHGTDDMQTKVKDYQQRLGGYVVEGPPSAPVVTFYDRAGSRAVYVGRFADGRLVEDTLVDGARAELSPLARRLIAAREAAVRAITADTSARPCTPAAFNTVILPPDTPDGAIAVYFLTARLEWSSIPLGGHYEIDVDASGKPGPTRRFTKACLNITLPQHADKDRTMQAITVSQLIGDTPTEIHFFTSITLHKPVYVLTGASDDARLWLIDGPRISEPVAPRR